MQINSKKIVNKKRHLSLCQNSRHILKRRITFDEKTYLKE